MGVPSLPGIVVNDGQRIVGVNDTNGQNSQLLDQIFQGDRSIESLGALVCGGHQSLCQLTGLAGPPCWWRREPPLNAGIETAVVTANLGGQVRREEIHR